MKKHQALRFLPKKILVPMDTSEASLIAWNQASGLARRFGSRIIGLYVQEWPEYPSIADGGTFDLMSQLRREALARLRSNLGLEADVRSAGGPVEATILAWSRNSDCDLIVMGTHGRTGLDRLFKGSVAETIVRKASVPVLVTRRSLPDFKSVLAPVNFEPYAAQGLFFAARIAEAFGARLTVMHAVNSPLYGEANAVKGPRHLLADCVRRLPEPLLRRCRPQTQLAFGDPAEQIIAAAKDADLVVMVAHRKGFLNDMILGTTAERVLRYCPKPILALPAGGVRPKGRLLAGAQNK